MKVFLIIIGLLTTIVTSAQPSTSDVWINEFHYDHLTTRGEGDSVEYVEIVIRKSIANNPDELSKYRLILYTSGALDAAGLMNGKNGLPYNVSSSWYNEQETVHMLSAYQQCPIANSDFTFLYKKLPILQDVPAGFALVYENTVVQLLSYEKSFKIASAERGGSAAAGMTTTLITKANSEPAMETATTPTNHSVSLLGSGTSYSNFQWDDGPTVASTPCALNTNGTTTQNFAATLPIRWISLSATGNRDAINVQWKVATNDDVDRYEIEAAAINGAFSKAGQLDARSSTTGSYQSTITNLRPGTYKVRIRSVMLTGEVEFSETRVVRLGTTRNPVLTVYPNPVRGGKVNVQIVPTERASFTVQLVDATGKIVSSRQTSMFEANSLNTVPLDLTQAAPGIYNVKIFNASEQHSTKIVVMK